MTEEEIADAAAELDVDPADGTAPAPTGSVSDNFSGLAVGGPWDGVEVDVRYPKGFLLVFKPNDAVWIYDRQPDGNFKIRNSQPVMLDDEKRNRAALGTDYDIRVLTPASCNEVIEP